MPDALKTAILKGLRIRSGLTAKIPTLEGETEYERAKVLPYNENDPCPPLVV